VNPNTVLGIARADIGYKEGPNNDTLAGKFTGANNQPWCASWIAFIFHRAGCPQLYPKRLVNCNDALAYFAKLGQLVPIDQAMPGDLVLFNFDQNPTTVEHIGIVYVPQPKLKRLVTIEGNTNNDGSANGDSVQKKSRPFGKIVAIARPRWETV